MAFLSLEYAMGEGQGSMAFLSLEYAMGEGNISLW